MNEGLAELYGAMLGDGCVSEYYANCDSRTRVCAVLTGHKHDEEYYKNAIIPIFKREFSTSGYLRHRTERNAIIFVTSKKSVIHFFRFCGFPVGKKEELCMPQEIESKNPLALACIRGIFDTDGSIYRRYSKKYKGHSRIYTHQVIQFKINSSRLLEQIKCVLESNGIITTRITPEKDSFVLRITRQDGVHRFMLLIRPNNPYHTERYLNTPRFF